MQPVRRIAAFRLSLTLIAAWTLASPAAERTRVERGSAEEKASKGDWSFTPDPKLPNVLILGDSISIGYGPMLRTELKGVANVYRPMSRDGKTPANCSDSKHGLQSLDSWLGDRQWRVIHFNFGLHDLKYLDEKGKYVTPDKGRQVASVEQYEKNLRAIVARLKKTGAVLVWASTTPVPDGSAGRVQGDERPYNAAAAKVMQENGVLFDDLCAALGDRLSGLQRPHNVHFTDEGSKALAHAVAESIRHALKQSP